MVSSFFFWYLRSISVIPGFSIPAFSTTPSQLRGSLSLLFFIRSTHCMYDLYHIHIWYKTSPPISPSIKAAVWVKWSLIRPLRAIYTTVPQLNFKMKSHWRTRLYIIGSSVCVLWRFRRASLTCKKPLGSRRKNDEANIVDFRHEQRKDKYWTGMCIDLSETGTDFIYGILLCPHCI